MLPQRDIWGSSALIAVPLTKDPLTDQDVNFPGNFNGQILGASDPLCNPLVWFTCLSLDNVCKTGTKSSPNLYVSQSDI